MTVELCSVCSNYKQKVQVMDDWRGVVTIHTLCLTCARERYPDKRGEIERVIKEEAGDLSITDPWGEPL